MFFYLFLSALSISGVTWGSRVLFRQVVSKWLGYSCETHCNLQMVLRSLPCSGLELHFPGYPNQTFLSFLLFSRWVVITVVISCLISSEPCCWSPEVLDYLALFVHWIPWQGIMLRAEGSALNTVLGWLWSSKQASVPTGLGLRESLCPLTFLGYPPLEVEGTLSMSSNTLYCLVGIDRLLQIL